MNRISLITTGLLAAIVATLVPASVARSADVDTYLWQTPRVNGLDTDAVQPMIDELRGQIDQILKAGPLAPLRMAYADLTFEAYWIYYERGRIITTLAYAYPHTTAEQQAGIKKYVRDLLSKPAHQPWQAGILKTTDGATRLLHGKLITEGRYVDGKNCPTLHVLYGLWLHGDRTGDWDAIKPNWSDIKTFYRNSGQSGLVLYGQMGAHIAMARMARQFGDSSAERMATAALKQDLKSGADASKIEDRVKKTRFAGFYGDRNEWAFAGQPWMFLDVCPEIARFIADNLKDEAVKRVNTMERTYPLWWLHQAPYFTRWTGDEGVGLTPEVFGMLYPIERWVKNTPPEQLDKFLKSTPVGIGDCYWIEALVQTIESHGDVSFEPLK